MYSIEILIPLYFNFLSGKTFCSKYRNLLIASTVVLVIAILIATAGGLGLSMWPQWHSNTAARFQTPGQPEATPGSVSQGRGVYLISKSCTCFILYLGGGYDMNFISV